MNIRIFSFFAGAGFLDLGFEKTGYEIVYVNEISKPFLDAYKYAREKLKLSPPLYGYFEDDVTTLVHGKHRANLTTLIKSSKKDNSIIGFIGGPPCPDFSVGGKNRGRHGENGILTATYFNLIEKQQPDFFLFENVKGLYRTKKHREFYEDLKYKIKQYYLITERLVNTIEYGVPQDRDRIVLIGFNKKYLSDVTILPRKTSFLLEELFDWDRNVRYRKDSVFALPWPKSSPFALDSTIPCPPGVREEITVEYWFNRNDVVNHSNAVHFFKPRNGLRRFSLIDEGDDSRKSFKRLHRWRYSPTVCYGNNEVHLHPYKVRRLTVAEALALQSLPKQFVLPSHISLTNMFKAIGNGVPFLAAKSLAKTIQDFLRVNNGVNSK